MKDEAILSFGAWLQRCRKASGLTQEELARQIGCSTITLRKIEAEERRPSVQIAECLADRLGVPAGERPAFVRFARGDPWAAPDTHFRSASEGAAWRLAPPINNLPAPLTRLIGRGRLVASACRMLSGDVRLLTLVGPPGSGKTRLALQVAFELQIRFPEGVWFVTLAVIQDPDLVISAITHALGIRETAGQSPLERLKSELRPKHLLLVLDNFEQVLEAAVLLPDLLSRCPQVKMLVTSRAPLNVYGEWRLPVPPLALPDLEHLPSEKALAHIPAVALLAERARAVQPGFAIRPENSAVVARLCVQLDGLPLAIELVTPHLNLLVPRSLSEQLDTSLLLRAGGMRDLPERQRTLYNAIHWSYDLLGTTEQALFRQSGVFVGGFTIQAASSVAGTPGSSRQTLEQIEALVNKNLLNREENTAGPRFSMLETIRQFALMLQETAGEAENCSQRHAGYFRSLVETTEPHLAGPQQAAWLDLLEVEHPNLRSALRWSLKQDRQTALCLAGGLWRFWLARGYLREGCRWLEAALSVDVQAGSPQADEAWITARAKALNGAGWMEQYLGDFAQARRLLDESLAHYERLGDEPGRAFALYGAGAAAYNTGDSERAKALYNQSLSLYRKLEDGWGISLLLNIFGRWAHFRGELDQAERFYTESLEIQRELGSAQSVATLLGNLGDLARDRGNYTAAARLIEEGLAIFQAQKNVQKTALLVNFLGETALSQGDLAQAKKCFEESLALAREIGDKWNLAFATKFLARLALLQGDHNLAISMSEQGYHLYAELGEQDSLALALKDLASLWLKLGNPDRAAGFYRKSLAALSQMGSRLYIAECLEGISNLQATQGRMAVAAKLLGAAEALRQMTGAPLALVLRPDRERCLATLRAQLGEAALASALETGRAMSLEQAVELGLEGI